MSKNDFNSLFDRLDALTVGFGPMFRNFQFETTGYPPHNIYKSSDSSFKLELAVAGFKKSEIEVRELNGEVTIQGLKDEGPADSDELTSEEVVSQYTKAPLSKYQYRGISNRNFIKRFKIAEYFEVKSVTMEDGMLEITFVKNVPEAAKPKIFEIK